MKTLSRYDSKSFYQKPFSNFAVNRERLLFTKCIFQVLLDLLRKFKGFISNLKNMTYRLKCVLITTRREGKTKPCPKAVGKKDNILLYLFG